MASPNSEEPYGEMIQFAMQGAADMSQVSVAVAIGLFGILAIFIAIKTVTGVGITENSWWWITDLWRLATVITLSVAYLALVTLGLACYLWRRQFDALIDEYLDNAYSKFQNDIRRVAKENWLTKTMFKLSWSGSLEKRRRRGIWIISASYLIITLSLLIVVGIY